MELPPELVQPIRDFSRPVFPHYQIYKEILVALRLPDWPLLKEALVNETTQILVKEYLVARDDWIQHVRDMERHYQPTEHFNYPQFVTRSKYLKQQLVRKEYREQQKFRHLSRHLYGEVRVLVDIRKELEKI